MKQRQSLKQGIAILVLLTAIGLPLACTTNNTSGPTSPGLATHTPTPGGFTATPTTTLVPGSTATFTPIPTTTATFVATPVFDSNTRLTAQPNAFFCSPGSLNVEVAEGEVTAGGDITMFENYTVGSSTANPNTDFIYVGVPTPGEGPTSFEGHSVLTIMNNPQGLAYTPNTAPNAHGEWVVLDSPGVIGGSGSATLYEGDNVFNLGITGSFREPIDSITSSYGGSPMKNPQSLTSDSNGNFYVADTGNARILDFAIGGYFINAVGTPAGQGFWTGSNTYQFKKPTVVVCDLAVPANVYVGDVGPGSSVVQEYASQGTTIKGSWTLPNNSIINGLAVDGSGDFYVSDIGNGIGGAGQVEEYKIIDSSHATLLRIWGDPKSPNEFAPFYPGPIVLIGNAALTAPLSNILVGDQNNDMIQVFGP